MSYNVDSTEVTRNDASMEARDVITLSEALEGELPEIHFLEDMAGAAQAALLAGEPTRLIPLPNLHWSGEGSGYAFKNILIKRIASRIRGRIDTIFTWEGGDSFSGLVIRDGKSHECKVVRRLKLPKGWGDNE